MNIKNVGILGDGQFGSFLKIIFSEHFPEVGVKMYGKERTPDNTKYFSLEDVCVCDIVFPCVPIAAFATVIDEIEPLLGKKNIVFDICTVKTYPLSILKKHNSIKYISSHPMFGLYSYAKRGNKLDGLRIVLCDHNLSDDFFARIYGILEALELHIVSMTADDHDKQLSETLFLTHLITQSVCTAGFTRTDIDTVSFGFLMDVVESVKHDTKLFHDVYRFNPYCKEMIQRWKNSEQKVFESLQQL